MTIQKLGRYEILLKLGRGTMGTVYKAVDPVIDRTVAIKAINLDLPKDEFEDFEERFYREAKSAGRLNHPNIVTIYDAGESENIAYIAMEYLEGQSLREILKAGTSMSYDRISEIVAQIADGLAYAQQHGIVHRDIKPANIMITKTGQVKITDFGIAHLPTGSKTETGTILGSPKYMSPEQIVGKSVDGRSDIFSLGVVLYEMLTKKAPFDGDSISNIMYRILNESPADIRKINKQIPIAFDFIVSKALAKLPENRYQKASELARDLRHYKTLSPPPSQLAALKQPQQQTLERRGTRRIEPAVTSLELVPDTRKEPVFPTATTMESTMKLTNRAYPIIELPGAKSKESQLKLTPAPKDHKGSKTALIAAGWLAVVAVALFMFFSEWWPAYETRIAGILGIPPAAKSETPGSDNIETERSLSTTTPLGKKTPGTAQSSKITTAPSATEGEVGYLNLDVTPRGEVYVDGFKMGISPPLKKLAVPTGKHRVVIKSKLPPYTFMFRVKIEENQSTSVKAHFEPES
ncbi:MAG TPA: serine/threonine-protein kinase [Burkholderiales bacterium]|nr:serine/threonine-protein kinase [Burkholderiales bacterium]